MELDNNHVKKVVILRFANPKIRASDHMSDIQKAVESASHNLYGRHDIVLSPTIQKYGIDVQLDLSIPADLEPVFNCGNRLRGISDYLLKHYDFYKQCRVGSRLLYYIIEE